MENSAVPFPTEVTAPRPHHLQVVTGNQDFAAAASEGLELGIPELDVGEALALPDGDFSEPEPAPEPALPAQPVPEISLPDFDSQPILDAVNAAIEAMRDRFAAAAATVRDQAEARIDSARRETDDTVGQLTIALDQIRHLRVQVEDHSRQAGELARVKETVRSLEGQLAEERAKYAEMQERLQVIAEGRAAAEDVAAKARAAAEVARREAASLAADLAAIRDGLSFTHPGPSSGNSTEIGRVAAVNALMPVQITAVADVMTVEERRTGVGVVFDIRIAAAMPLDMTHSAEPVQDAIDHIIALAQAMHPTAVLTMAFGSAEDHAEALARHPHVTFIAPPAADDRRQKAAHVLATAARNLSQ